MLSFTAFPTKNTSQASDPYEWEVPSEFLWGESKALTFSYNGRLRQVLLAL